MFFNYNANKEVLWGGIHESSKFSMNATYLVINITFVSLCCIFSRSESAPSKRIKKTFELWGIQPKSSCSVSPAPRNSAMDIVERCSQGLYERDEHTELELSSASKSNAKWEMLNQMLA
eukprot:756256-Hanusia_phi.AAC.6